MTHTKASIHERAYHQANKGKDERVEMKPTVEQMIEVLRAQAKCCRRDNAPYCAEIYDAAADNLTASPYKANYEENLAFIRRIQADALASRAPEPEKQENSNGRLESQIHRGTRTESGEGISGNVHGTDVFGGSDSYRGIRDNRLADLVKIIDDNIMLDEGEMREFIGDFAVIEIAKFLAPEPQPLKEGELAACTARYVKEQRWHAKLCRQGAGDGIAEAINLEAWAAHMEALQATIPAQKDAEVSGNAHLQYVENIIAKGKMHEEVRNATYEECAVWCDIEVKNAEECLKIDLIPTAKASADGWRDVCIQLGKRFRALKSTGAK